ncbi:MAG: peptidoglycan-binding protein [Oscillospiraceae bacterium]|nr:peptidoglycan-binding protein [Oscillospiraceae bacterium]
MTGVNFGPNEGADWLRTGSGKSFEEFWGVGPYGSPISSGASQQSSGNNGVNFGENEGADWLRTGSGKTFEEFWGVGPYGMLVTIKETNSINNTDSTSNSPVLANLNFTRYGIQMTHSLVPSSSNYGSREVWALQEFLMDFGYFANPNTVLTGNFGPATTEALMRFQIVYLNMDAESLFDSNGLYIGCDIYTMLAINGAITMHSLYGADISYENRLRTVAYIERHTLAEGSDYVVYDKADNKGVYRALFSQNQLQAIYVATNRTTNGSDAVATLNSVSDLNYTLWRYGITSIEFIQFFLGVAMHESRTGLTQDGHTSKYRGAGFIQLTGEGNYKAFYTENGDPGIFYSADPAMYVASY